MTVDEQPYYSPTAVAFCLEQPCALPRKTTTANGNSRKAIRC